jgi:hypothetical protein
LKAVKEHNDIDGDSTSQGRLKKALQTYRARNYAIAMGLEFKNDSELRLRRIELLQPRDTLSRMDKFRQEYRSKLIAGTANAPSEKLNAR